MWKLLELLLETIFWSNCAASGGVCRSLLGLAVTSCQLIYETGQDGKDSESRIHVTSISVSTSDNVVVVLVVVVIITVVLVVVIVEVVINFSSSDLCIITARSAVVVAATDNKCKSRMRIKCSNLTNVSSFLNRTDDVSAAAVEGWVSNIVPALCSAC